MNGNETRGAQIHISADLLFQLLGLPRGRINLGYATLDSDNPDVLILVLRGEDERLPLVTKGLTWPRATIIAERIEARLKI